MYEIDKARFGAFVAAQRKKKGWTQKDLAQRLFVSDKAVSKWERGLSAPDIALLIPLADSLDITVTELLEGRAMEPEQERDTGQTEELLRKVLDLSAEETRENTRQKRRNTMVFFALAGVQALELAGLAAMGYELETMMKGAMGTYVMMVLLLGAHAWVVLKDRLPAYYDQYPIRDYTGGILHMSVGNLHFNNRNWPYVLRCLRAWSAFHAVLSGPFYWTLDHLPAGQWQAAGNSVWILLVVGGLFIPVYIAGKRHE